MTPEDRLTELVATLARLRSRLVLRDSRHRPCLSLHEAARQLGCAVPVLRRAVRAGVLPAERRADGVWLVPVWALQRRARERAARAARGLPTTANPAGGAPRTP